LKRFYTEKVKGLDRRMGRTVPRLAIWSEPPPFMTDCLTPEC
jgi:hypothetical protein